MMNINKWIIILLLSLFGVGVVHSQESHTEICIDFRVNSTVIDPTYSDNAHRMQEIIEFLRSIREDSTTNIIEVSFCGAASPEGSDRLNRQLAQGRLTALEAIVRKEVDIPDSLITHNDSYIPWNYLKGQIKASECEYKDKIISILDNETDDRISKLKALDNGKVWKQMNRLFFAQMRNACVVLVTYQEPLPVLPEPIIISEPVAEPDTVTAEPELVVEPIEVLPDTMVVVEAVLPEVEGWTRQLHVKTNAIGLGMAIANLAVEVDICKHLSFTLPVYYSAWDYFKTTIKFRTLGIQPEIRYWFHPDNEGWFIGAHFGMAYYNIAWDGDYRYQDHNRETPAMGGGIAAGYRTHLSKNKKWKMEFSLGGGAYLLDYDKFHNTRVTKEGLMVKSSINKTYWGLDQASISVAYSFDLKKKGDKK